MIELNHTIVPSHDKVKTAQFYARILGIKLEGEVLILLQYGLMNR